MRIGAWLTCVCMSVIFAGASPANVMASGSGIDDTDIIGMTPEEAEGLIASARVAVPRDPLHWWLGGDLPYGLLVADS